MRRKSGIVVIIMLLVAVLASSSNLAIAQNNQSEETSYEATRHILGNDFITPEEISSVFGFIYTKKQLVHFEETLPSENTLRWAKENGYAVIAGPPTPMNILVIHAFRPKLFTVSWSQEEAWYYDESFAKNDQVTTNWLIIKKEPLPNSVSKYWVDQISLLLNDEYVPNIAEASWSMVIFYEVRKMRLFERVYVRTASLVSNGNHVIVGFFGGQGMVIHSYWDLYHTNSIGLTALKSY